MSILWVGGNAPQHTLRPKSLATSVPAATGPETVTGTRAEIPALIHYQYTFKTTSEFPKYFLEILVLQM